MLAQPPYAPRQIRSSGRSTWRQFCRSPPLGDFLCATFFISLILIIAFLVLSWAVVARDAQSLDDLMLSKNTSGLLLFGHAFQLDLGAHTLSVRWTPVVCGNVSPDRVPVGGRIPNNCGLFDRAFDLYFDDPSQPVFTFVSHVHIGGAPEIRDQPGFTMEHQVDNSGEWDTVEQFTVPFDRYVFYVHGFAIDPTTNRSLPMGMSVVADTLGDFVILSRDAEVTGEFTHDSRDGLVTADIEACVLRAEIKRSAIAKAFTISLWLINWSLTTSSIYVTALVMYGRLEANNTVVALPFSALLAIPAIRSLRTTPSPPESSVGTAAFLVQLTAVALCSLFLLRALTKH